MAWTLDSYEIEIKSDPRSPESRNAFYHVEDLFIREVDDLVFFGRVKDSENKGLEGALLKVFACRTDGSEMALSHTYSGKNGYYLVNIPKPNYPVVRYIVRSSRSSNPPEICEQSLSRSRSQERLSR